MTEGDRIADFTILLLTRHTICRITESVELDIWSLATLQRLCERVIFLGKR